MKKQASVNNNSNSKRTARADNLIKTDTLVVKTSTFGITSERATELARSVIRHRAVVKFLGRSRNRLLSFEILDAESKTKPARPTSPNRFRATFFDYTRNRTIYATGNVNRPGATLLTKNGYYILLNAPGSIQTYATGIASLDQIVGFYLDASYTYHGFLRR